MKKAKLLSITALALIGLLGLSGCGSNEVIEGPVGPQGPQGPAGENGQDGEDGTDGATWLTGTGVPKDTDGKTNDMYLNTSNGDVYQKQADGSWKLVMNIKGEDGKDGEDGEDGRPGGSGSNGKTAYSNTILPIEGAYITANVGSAVVGGKVIFTVHDTDPTDNKEFKTIKLNEETFNLDSEGKYEATMVEGGFVVSADATVLTSSKDLEQQLSQLESGLNTITLSANETITADSTGSIYNLAVGADQELVLDGNGSTINLVQGSNPFDLTNCEGPVTFKNFTIQSTSDNKESTDGVMIAPSSKADVIIENCTIVGQNTNGKNNLRSAIWVEATENTAKEVIIRNNTFKGYGPIQLAESNANVTITGNKFVDYASWMNAITVGGALKDVTIGDNEFSGNFLMFHRNINLDTFSLENVTISNNKFTGTPAFEAPFESQYYVDYTNFGSLTPTAEQKTAYDNLVANIKEAVSNGKLKDDNQELKTADELLAYLTSLTQQQP